MIQPYLKPDEAGSKLRVLRVYTHAKTSAWVASAA